MYTHHACIFTIYTPNTPLNTLYTPYLRPIYALYAVLMTGEVGTPAYMAVELARGDSKSYDSSVDVFSFGVLLWALWTGSEPYNDMSINNAFHLMDQVCAGMRPKVPQSMPQGLQVCVAIILHRV